MGSTEGHVLLTGRGYAEADVERAVTAAADVDMSECFKRHVAGREMRAAG